MADARTAFPPWLLLVEDEAPLAEATQAILTGDFHVDVAGTVAEALQLLGTKQYAVIISDHMLPGKEQWLNFLIKALELQPKAKRILMTGYLNPELLGRSVSVAQLSACLIKPVPMATLRAELHRVLGG